MMKPNDSVVVKSSVLSSLSLYCAIASGLSPLSSISSVLSSIDTSARLDPLGLYCGVLWSDARSAAAS